jgi:hypothetical protein
VGSIDGGLTIQRARQRARLAVVALIAVTLVGGALRFHRIDRHGFWLDEAFSVWMAEHPLPELFAWLTRIDQHPPLYYTLLHFWLLPGDEAGYVRLLSAGLSTLAIPVLFLIGRRIGGAPIGLTAALILALSPFHVRFAQEARMYALLTLNVALATWGLVGILSGGHLLEVPPPGSGTSRKSLPPGGGLRLAWLVYILFTAAAVLTHSTASFFPLAANLFVIGFIFYRRKWPAAEETTNIRSFTPPPLRAWLPAQGGVLLLWLPWSYSFMVQSIGVYNQFWIQAPTLATVASAFQTLLNDFLPPRLPAALVWAGYALLLVLGAVHLRKRLPVLALLLALVLTPVLGELLVSLRRPIFYDRTLIWITLPLYLLLAFGLTQLRPRPLLIGGLALLCTVSLLSLQNYYDNFQKEEWREAAADLAQAVQTNDLILFNATWVQIPFDYYFRRFALPVTEHGAPVDLFDGGALEPQMTAADLPRLRSLVQNRERVWLVYSHDWYTDPAKLIPAALAEEFDLMGRQEYYGLQVLQYVR